MKVVDIATEIYIEQGSPTSTSIPAVAYWIRSKVGWLNTMLYEDLVIDTTTLEITNRGAEIDPQIVAILTQAYKIYDLEVQIRSAMNALAADSILEVSDNLGGTSFRRVNRNEIAKTLITIRKDEIGALKILIDSYRSLTSQPSQVAGDDTQSGVPEVYTLYRPFIRRL